jgi:hypothetical protein
VLLAVTIVPWHCAADAPLAIDTLAQTAAKAPNNRIVFFMTFLPSLSSFHSRKEV